MSAKRGILTSLIVTALALVLPLSAFAAEPTQIRAVTECVPVGNVVYDFITYDNGMQGLWASDYFHSVVSICQLGENLYRVTYVDGGYFITLDAGSPGGGGLVSAGIKGNIVGGISMIIEGELVDPLPSHVGTIDYRSMERPIPYEGPFFVDGEYERVEYLSWGWSYSTCGNGTWVDNEETEAAYAEQGPNGLMGDVIGEPVACPEPANPVVRNLWAYVNPSAEDEAAQGNICYILSLTQPIQHVELDKENTVRRLCYPTSSPDWWQGAVLLTHGDVFENGTDWGFWEGDAIASAFSSAKRLPLHADGPNNDLLDRAEMFPWTQGE